MAATVADDKNDIQTYDTNVGFGIGNVGSPNAAVANPRVEGTNSNDARVNGTGVGGTGFNAGSTDVSTKHVFQWVRTLDDVASRANDGWRIRLSSNTAGTADYDEITVAGNDTARSRINGFSVFCCNALRDGENVNGTPPAATAVISFTAIADHLTASNRFTWFIDAVKRMTGITVTAGTVSVPGNSDDITSDDTTTGRGSFKDIGGTIFILGRVTIGDVTAATDSHFTDTLKVWLFEDQPVKNDFHKIEFVGGTGTNAATFGSEVGSGITAVGVGGNTFLTSRTTTACFSLVAVDADITVKLFGCNFINSLYEDHCFQAWQEDNSVPSFTGRNREANITSVTGTMFPATEASNDAFYIGDRDRAFFGAQVDLSTVGVGTPTLAFEYHNGTAWTALPTLVDGTSGLTADGRITWAKPADWSSVAVNSVTAFYMRVRIVSGTFSTNPVIASFRPLHAGLIQLEQANADAISCLFSGCGPISIRNGALFRKCIVTDSNAGAEGALDLGATDPASDSVRDLQIQNSTTGILLRKTAAGNVTYNFRNIKFAGNTNDVRVDFPSGSTVTINILEGGDTPSIQNVNGSTVTIVNTVTVAVTVVDAAGAAVNLAQVWIAEGTDPQNPGPVILNADTNASGLASTTFNFTADQPILIRIRKNSIGSTRYFPVATTGTITVNGFALKRTLVEDTIAG